MNAELTELVFILDRSGSMGGLESDTIGGFNGMIERQKKEGEKVNVTTILFDDEVFHIDGVLRSLNISHHPVKKRHSVRNQLHLIVLAVKSVSVDLIQLDQMPPVFGRRAMKRVARIFHFLHLFF